MHNEKVSGRLGEWGTGRFLLTAIFVLALSGKMQAQSIAGSWTAEYPSGVRNVNGQITSTNGIALLSIEIKGDSVFGTWQPQNTPMKVEPRRIVGTFKNGELSFVGEPVAATIQRAGDGSNQQQVMMRSFFDAKLENGALVGTMSSKSDDGMISSPQLKWSAKRTAPAGS